MSKDLDSSLSDALKGALVKKQSGKVQNFGKPVFDDDPIPESEAVETSSKLVEPSAKKVLTKSSDKPKVRKKRVGHSNITAQFRLNGDASQRLENLLLKANAKGMDLDFKSALNLIVYSASKLSNKEFQDLVVKSRIELSAEST